MFTLSKTLKGHSDFVAAIAWFPPSQQLVKGGIVSGGLDKAVFLWDLTTGEIVQRMKGHQEIVTDVAVAESRDIFSSSLDGTIRQWREGRLINCWEAHAKGVEELKQLPTGELVTYIVRCIAVLSELIISASQDCSNKLWAKNGEVLKEMVGHTSVISVDAHSSGLVASGSEDCFIKIWKDGLCIQSIELFDYIWDVKFLENGDIVTACGDGVVRIWTSHKDRIAEAIELEFYKISLAERWKLGLEKLMDIEAFNSPDQDQVLAPTAVAPTVDQPLEPHQDQPLAPTTVDQLLEPLEPHQDQPLAPTTVDQLLEPHKGTPTQLLEPYQDTPKPIEPHQDQPPTPTTIVDQPLEPHQDIPTQPLEPHQDQPGALQAPNCAVVVGGDENRFQRSSIVNCSVFLSTIALAFITSVLMVNNKEKSEKFRKLGLLFCVIAECVLFIYAYLIYIVSRYRHHDRYATIMLFILGGIFSFLLMALLFVDLSGVW